MDPEALLKRAGVVASGSGLRLAGGDTSEVWRVGEYVVKTARRSSDMWHAEARGLQALRRATVRAPEVLWVDSDGLVMRYLRPGPRDPLDLARQIGRLHCARLERYGSEETVYLGPQQVDAGWMDDWKEGWCSLRVVPFLRRTWTVLGELGPRVDRLLRRFEPPLEGPVQLHGDLWAGNAYDSEQGAVLIDPSAWAGERGVDLAMMKLFGGFSRECWREMEAIVPIPQELAEALPYYQLYFLLAHVQFFGASYLSGVQRVLRFYGD